jgi:TolA-binding protein
LYNSGDYETAMFYYAKLEKVSSRPSTLHNTQIGLMRCNFFLENWLSASEYSKKVLANTLTASTIKLESEYVKGISFYQLENYTEAKPSLEWVVKNTTTVMAPESKFYLAEMYYKQKEHVKAETEIRALLKMKPSYDFWIAKALILQSKVLIAKQDLFQAEHTLQSVIENYTIQDDGILLEANQLWDELMQLKSTPKVVEEKKSTEIEINEKDN